MSSKLNLEFPSNIAEITNLNQNSMAQYESIRVVEIFNCPSTLEASKLISNSVFRLALESLDNFRIVIFKINDEIKEEHAEKPKLHEFKIKRNFLISYESTVKNFTHQKVIYWKNGENFLKFNMLIGYSVEMTDYVRDFMIEIVELYLSDNSLINYLELVDLINLNGCNLLMKAVRSGQSLALIEELLKLPFNVNQKNFKSNETAADIAWFRKNFKTLLKLLEANSTFSKDFDIDELVATDASEKIKSFIQISEDMHAAINSNDVDKITELINKKPNLRYFYNSSNISAAKTALIAKNLYIYEILLKNNLSIGPNENLEEIITVAAVDESLQKAMRSSLLITHTNASKQLPENHLNILNSKSVICHDDQFISHRARAIREVFEILNDIPIMRQILQIVATHKNLKIHFDFNRSSVQYMNPLNGTRDMRGVYFYNGTVYVAASSFVKPAVQNEGIGSLAHELTHFALNLAFCNFAKPYAIDDEENETKFSEILKKCEVLKENEVIIKDVFYYVDCEKPAELIVRVPHMHVQFRNEKIKLNQIKTIFSELFQYYDDVVKPRLSETLIMLEKIFNNSIEIVYDDLTDAYKAKIHQSIVDFQGIDVKLNEIIEDKNSSAFKHLTAKHIRGFLLKNKLLVIGCAQNIDFYVERDFIDCENCRKNLSSIGDEKMILLSDHFGAGKTTTFKYLSIKLKEKFPNYWISYVDLKKHSNVYEKFIENQIVEILIEILDIIVDFEIEIFTHLYNSERVIILFDGFDEMSLKFKEFFIKIIEIIRQSNNQQWISTRPQHMQELATKFNLKAYKFPPYNEDSKIDFISNVLKNLEADESLANEILSFLSNNHNIDNPLMLKAITELYLQDKSIVDKSNLYYPGYGHLKNVS